MVTRRIAVPPGKKLTYVSEDWDDSLVVVEEGSIELESLHGARRTFVAGDMLSLRRLHLRALRNRGHSVTVLALLATRRGLTAISGRQPIDRIRPRSVTRLP